MTFINFTTHVTYKISTHTLTWSVTRDACMVCNANPNFNSHAHVERDAYTKVATLQLGISTHTLTWSVTIESAETIILQCISTHTLTWSVTITGLKRGDNNADFNSHAHVERDMRYRCHSQKCRLFQLTRSRGA